MDAARSCSLSDLELRSWTRRETAPDAGKQAEVKPLPASFIRALAASSCTASSASDEPQGAASS